MIVQNNLFILSLQSDSMKDKNMIKSISNKRVAYDELIPTILI